MDKITEYRSVKNPKIAATICWGTVVIVLILFVFGIKFGLKPLNGIPLFIPLIINIINIFYPIFYFQIKYIINETDLTFRIKGDLTIKRVIPIGDVYKIDVYQNKKGKIRYFLLRTPPSAYVRVSPYYKHQFLSHILSLNPEIEVQYF